MEYRLLGPVGVLAAGRPVDVGSRRERTLLALLLLAAGQVVSTDRMIEAVWGERPPATARRQVHTVISTIRQAVGDVLVTQQPGYRLLVEPDQVDWRRFESLAAEARRAGADGRLPEAADRLRAALSLWRGPALGGVTGLAGQAARLSERRLGVQEERIEVELSLGRHADLVPELSALVVEFPLRPRLRAALMLALYRCGRPADAVAAYRQARRAFIAELGMEPPAELRRLEQAILSDDPSLTLPAPEPVPAGPPDTGPTVPRPSLLPPDIADFIGRDDQVELLRRVLAEPAGSAVPVSAIDGRGGVGKTALAVHVAHQLRDVFGDGQLYVNLHGVQDRPADPAVVLARFLSVLGVDAAAIPDGIEQRAELYRNRLAGRRVLVLLDNAMDEAQVTPLLPGDPSCGVLVTSRARLGGIPGARTVGLDALEPAKAVRLLAGIVGAGRAAAEQPAAVELAGLCGHLPLAVRIAGAKLAARPHWRLADLVRRLAGERGRLDELVHGGLEVRASLGLSYRGLGPAARRLFRRLGLLDAPDFAGWVCAALLDLDLAAAERLLDQLMDARLLEVVTTEPSAPLRYRFHDLVRDYARERAADQEPAAERTAALRRAFGAWLGLAERAHQRTYGGDYLIIHGDAARWELPPDLVESLLADPPRWWEAERSAMVSVICQAAATGLDELAWDLAHSSVTLYNRRSHVDLWRPVYADVLAAVTAAGNRRGEAAMLLFLGTLDDATGHYEQAMRCLESALARFGELDDRHGVALAACAVAGVLRKLSRLQPSLSYGARAVAALRGVRDGPCQVIAMRNMAFTHLDLGDFDQAERLVTEALPVARDSGHQVVYVQTLLVSGEIQLRRGELAAAEESLRQVLRLARELDYRPLEGQTLDRLGTCLLRQGRLTDAEAMFTAGLRLADDTAPAMARAYLLFGLGRVHHQLGRVDSAIDVLDQALALWRRLKTPLWEARTLREVGNVHRTRGDHAAAQSALARASALVAELGAAETEQLTS